MKRGRPTHALGGGARKDHLFEDKRSLCGKYIYGGGREVDPEGLVVDPSEVCKRCARAADNIVVRSDAP